MTWETFVKFWKDLWDAIVRWFTSSDASGMNNLSRFILAIVILIVGHYLIKFIMRVIRKISGVSKKLTVDVSVKTFTLAVFSLILNIGLAILVLSLLNVNISSLAQIVSAGTVAIGLALQDIISAFASGVLILRAHLFKTGDYITVNHNLGSSDGTVVSVNVLSTVLETPSGQRVIIPNNKVAQGVVTNYSTNPVRRFSVEIGVDYDTDIDACRASLLKVAAGDSRILLHPEPSVFIDRLGDSCLVFVIRGYVKNADYWNVVHEIYERILKQFEIDNIEIPYDHLVIEQYKDEPKK